MKLNHDFKHQKQIGLAKTKTLKYVFKYSYLDLLHFYGARLFGTFIPPPWVAPK
jgi:hypothetical protein